MKKNDIILLATILAVSFVAFILFNILLPQQGAYVEIVVKGEVVKSLPLDENTQYMIVSEKGYNVLDINNREAKITDASCPDKLCMHQKSIKSSDESLICLPNEVVVRVVGETDASELDGIAD
ncbi:NusG domain II-containing protein [Parasporobacterium paucivorans]|uniref:Uncharacterized protein n=1 Tax=Parasporobacterium paucivorans DSM 15970 TaxID=1122934 RepID=A0A1M6AC40_9FIRM|nr:NusG domain II-containing protein [Parasporobacterium paucivorans]SHI34094.1 hypothetical protein SAMN02745691_00129 [Parasporobacterium paucivorans DSM 15970]